MNSTCEHRSEEATRSPRGLFWLTVGLALALIALVVAAPWFKSEASLLALFAHDVPVRRSALGAGLGLLVTAFVFFRGSADEPDAKQRPKKPQPPRVVGA